MGMTLEEFVLKYQKYAMLWASNYYVQVFDYGIDLEDLRQAGLLALVECYTKYDSSKSSPSTFAYLSVKYGIYKYIQTNRSATYIPAGLQVISHTFNIYKAQFYISNGRNMTMEEMLLFLQNECNTSDYVVNEEFVSLLLKIEAYHLNNRKYSLEDKVDNYDTTSISYYEDIKDACLKDVLLCDYNLEEEVIKSVEADMYLDYIKNNVDEMSFKIFKKILGFDDGIPKTRVQVAEEFGFKNQQAVSQRYDRAIKKLRKKFNISD